jgi:hypothetical protein
MNLTIQAANYDQTQSAAPGVPIRFGTASEQRWHLTNPNLAKEPHGASLKSAMESKVKKLSLRRICPLQKRPVQRQ